MIEPPSGRRIDAAGDGPVAAHADLAAGSHAGRLSCPPLSQRAYQSAARFAGGHPFALIEIWPPFTAGLE
jgi:hypothetical protein